MSEWTVWMERGQGTLVLKASKADARGAVVVEVPDFMAIAFIDREREIDHLKQWVHDLQSGMYINCVYCGHRYGPSESTPASMADVLKAHVEECEAHPMHALREAIAELGAWQCLNGHWNTGANRCPKCP